MEESFSCLVGVQGVAKSAEDRQDVRRSGKQERDDLAVAERLDDSWKEVRYACRADHTKEHKHQDPDLDVSHCQGETVEERLILAAGPVVDSNIFLQSPDCELAFFFSEPFGGSREVRQDEEANASNHDGHCAFNDCWLLELVLEMPLAHLLKSHLQAGRPSLRSIPSVMPAAIRPAKAPEMSDPEYKTAERKASSFLVYQHDRKNRQPGK